MTLPDCLQALLAIYYGVLTMAILTMATLTMTACRRCWGEP